MGLHITVGFDGQGKSAAPRVIYAGNSKSEALAAEAADTISVRFERFSNVTGLRKNNPNYKAPTAANESSTPAPGNGTDGAGDPHPVSEDPAPSHHVERHSRLKKPSHP